MIIQRLSWAGLRITTPGAVLLIDPLETVEAVIPVGLGTPREPAVAAAAPAEVDAALITHVHPDHFDPTLLRRVLKPDATVFCPAGMVAAVQAAGLRPHGMEAGESARVADAEVTAVPAVDGFGEHQLSWIVSAAGRRILHAGDTIWHGYWWRIARKHGAVDLAFLPINGPLLELPGIVPSGVPAALTPEQAVAAAAILGAGALCPIHYGMFENPPLYAEHPDALGELQRSAERRGVGLRIAAPGQAVPVAVAEEAVI